MRHLQAIDAVLQKCFDAAIHWVMRTAGVSKYFIRHQIWLAMNGALLTRWVLMLVNGKMTAERVLSTGFLLTAIFMLMKRCAVCDQQAERTGMRSRVDIAVPYLKGLWWGVLIVQTLGYYDTHLTLEWLINLGWLSQEYLRYTQPTPPARRSQQRVFQLSQQHA